MKKSYYGEFGGQYVAESLMNTLAELEKAFDEAVADSKFWEEYNYYLREYVGRETSLYLAERLSEKYGTKIYLKREDLTILAPTRLTMLSDRFCWQNAWGKPRSSVKPVQVSTVWQLPQALLCSIWSVPFTWERRTWNAST